MVIGLGLFLFLFLSVQMLTSRFTELISHSLTMLTPKFKCYLPFCHFHVQKIGIPGNHHTLECSNLKHKVISALCQMSVFRINSILFPWKRTGPLAIGQCLPINSAMVPHISSIYKGWHETSEGLAQIFLFILAHFSFISSSVLISCVFLYAFLEMRMNFFYLKSVKFCSNFPLCYLEFEHVSLFAKMYSLNSKQTEDHF